MRVTVRATVSVVAREEDTEIEAILEGTMEAVETSISGVESTISPRTIQGTIEDTDIY